MELILYFAAGVVIGAFVVKLARMEGESNEDSYMRQCARYEARWESRSKQKS